MSGSLLTLILCDSVTYLSSIRTDERKRGTGLPSLMIARVLVFSGYRALQRCRVLYLVGLPGSLCRALRVAGPVQ